MHNLFQQQRCTNLRVNAPMFAGQESGRMHIHMNILAVRMRLWEEKVAAFVKFKCCTFLHTAFSEVKIHSHLN